MTTDELILAEGAMDYEIESLAYRFDVATELPKPSRDMVLALEDLLRTMPPGEAPITNHFSDGIYAREMFIPKGTVLTGKIHRFAHLNFILKGDITVLTEHGVRRIKGPCVLQSSAGIKRAGYAHEDTIWITVHPTNETDVDKIEEHFIAKDFTEFAQIDCDRIAGSLA